MEMYLGGCTERVTAREEKACGIVGSKTRFGSENLLENQAIAMGTLTRPHDYMAGLMEGRRSVFGL